tara:strand:+ start:1208 stop:1438 length:231 start_codon:yes stop_codon:yes gene_type:complete
MIYSDYIAHYIQTELKKDPKGIVSEVGYVDSSESNWVTGPFKKKVSVTDKYNTKYIVTVQEVRYTTPTGRTITYDT